MPTSSSPRSTGRLPPPPVAKDETVALVAEDIEETTRDFILKQLAQELKGHPLAHFFAHLLEAMGYRTRVSPEGPDGGIDIVAHKDELSFEPPIIKVQVKSSEGSVGEPVVAVLYGQVTGPGEFGLLVTLGTFTPSARNFARGKTNLRLIDGEGLVALVLQHYESFDSRYKGMIARSSTCTCRSRWRRARSSRDDADTFAPVCILTVALAGRPGLGEGRGRSMNHGMRPARNSSQCNSEA